MTRIEIAAEEVNRWKYEDQCQGIAAATWAMVISVLVILMGGMWLAHLAVLHFGAAS